MIVWWRAWVIWGRNRWILLPGIAFPLTTLGTSLPPPHLFRLLSAIRYCAVCAAKITHDIFTGAVPSHDYRDGSQNRLLPVFIPGFAAFVLSLCSNALTVLLVAYKTWCVRLSHGTLTKD